MYFSRIQINPRRREAMKLLSSPRAMHAAVESAFPPDRGESDEGRVLWRIDADQHDVRLYVVSPHQPDLRHLAEQAGWETSPGEHIDYRPFLDGLQVGQRFGFRVTVNPVKRDFVKGGRGRLVPLVGATQLDWFVQRSAGWGFRVRPMGLPEEIGTEASAERLDLQAERQRSWTFGKDQHGRRFDVTQHHTTLTGRLEVTEATALRQALVRGMGRGKAYGCGLMTLARAR